MLIEYDPTVDEGFIPDRNGVGQAGIAAICSLGITKGYFNVAATQTNLIFVVNEEREKFYGAEADQAPKAAVGQACCRNTRSARSGDGTGTGDQDCGGSVASAVRIEQLLGLRERSTSTVAHPNSELLLGCFGASAWRRRWRTTSPRASIGF
jgi:hypothetical protein